MQIIEDAFYLNFLGGSFSNISVVFDTVDNVNMKGVLSSSSANETDPIIKVTLHVEVAESLRQRIYFTVASSEGAITALSSHVFVDVRFREPKIRVLPASMDIKLVRGGRARYEDVTLENIGSLQSDLIQVIVPDQPLIRPVSEYISRIAVDEETIVSFRVQAPEEFEIGSGFTGTIGFVSNSSVPAQLHFRATIVSSIPVNLTIVTQNEATFLSEEKPNLAFVSLKVRSLLLGDVYNLDSGPNGIVTLTLKEGYYEIYAQKLEHRSFRRTIFLESPGTTIGAFLEYQAVSYTFTIVEVPVVDRYEIVTKTTFKTS